MHTNKNTNVPKRPQTGETSDYESDTVWLAINSALRASSRAVNFQQAMRFGQLVIGPAGSGKSTFCHTIWEHGKATRRNFKVVNLDPAAEHFKYSCYADVRELISVKDVIQDDELRLGPNGALVFCMEYLVDRLWWLEDTVGEADDDYFLFDCPGQIELYTHCQAVRRIVATLQRLDIKLCAVFILDSQFMSDVPKFLSGSLVALSTMVNLELPHVNVLSKMDLLSPENRSHVESFAEADPRLIDEIRDEDRFSAKYRHLTARLNGLLENYSLVRYVLLDITDEESVSDLLLTIDNVVQYGEDLEVRDHLPQPEDD